MSVLIGAARIDENGRIYGGQDGDQNGHEVEAYAWSDRNDDGWNVLRYADESLRAKAVEYAWQIINNENIGYNQYKHFTLIKEARKVNYDFSKITTKCSTDCCQMQVAIAEALGITVPTCYTATQVKAFMSTGAFEHLTGSKYAHTDQYLMAGDIGCMPSGVQGHTWIALEDGPLAKSGSDTSAKTYVATGNVWLRTGPGRNYAKASSSAILKGSYVTVYSIENNWAKCSYNGVSGYASARYLKEVEVETEPETPKISEYVTTGNVWLRKLPGTSGFSLTVIRKGTKLVSTGESETVKGTEWVKVEYSNKVGWVSTKYLSNV